jgi:hypothetical protein
VNESHSQAPLILTVIVAGLLVSWVIRKVQPGMPLVRRLLFIVGGGVILGGVIYGVIFRS